MNEDVKKKKILKKLPTPKCPICKCPLILTTNVWGEIIAWCPKHGTVKRIGISQRDERK